MRRTMMRLTMFMLGPALLTLVFLGWLPAVKGTEASSSNGPVYNKNGDLVVPTNYREWIFLSSGVDMVYGPKRTADPERSAFDNVFVNPEAYRSFLAQGTWPDKTLMILEVRGADTNPSINHGGHSQGPLAGMEVHVKDSSRFSGGWAFFDVKPSGVATLIPQPADCYTCHREHAAVDTTFVQFYPTLLPVARTKGTLSDAFVRESGTVQSVK